MDVRLPAAEASRGLASKRGQIPGDSRVAALRALALPAALFLLAGCTSLAQPYAFNGPAYAAEPPIFLDGRPRLVDPDKVDRYACRTGMPLECRCVGRLAASCECSCPPAVP